MNDSASNRILWNLATKNGLLLGLFTALCRILSQTLSTGEASAGMAVLNLIIWLVQFVGCIFLMKFFMERLVAGHKDADNRDTARYGRMLALTSSLIFSSAMLFDVVFLDPDMAGQQIELIRQLYGGSLDSDTLELIGKEGFYPKVMFFSNLIYGFVYGAILSWILSRYIPKRDPFSSYMDKNGK